MAEPASVANEIRVKAGFLADLTNKQQKMPRFPCKVICLYLALSVPNIMKNEETATRISGTATRGRR